MGLMDRIKKVTGTNENNSYDDSYDDDYYDGFDGYEEDVDDGDIQMAGAAPQSGMNNAPMGGMGAQMGGISLNATGSSIQMKVVRPRAYDSETATQIADHLLNKCTVVLNLENTNKEASRRLIDFLTGVAYSIGGSLKQVSTNTYLVAPSSVDVADSKIKQAARRQEPQPEPKEVPVEEFGDFN